MKTIQEDAVADLSVNKTISLRKVEDVKPESRRRFRFGVCCNFVCCTVAEMKAAVDEGVTVAKEVVATVDKVEDVVVAVVEDMKEAVEKVMDAPGVKEILEDVVPGVKDVVEVVEKIEEAIEKKE